MMKTLSTISRPGAWLLHVTGWAVLIASELTYLAVLKIRLEPWYAYLVTHGLGIGVFYGHFAILNFIFVYRKGLIKGISLFICLIGLYLFLKLFYSDFRSHWYVTERKQLLFTFLYRAAQFIILATFSWAAGRLAVSRVNLRLAEQETKLLEANLREQLQRTELAYLRQRLNPHLMFNTLNLMYAQVFEQSREAAEDVLLLSEIMRYSVCEPGEDGKVPLMAELGQVENLLLLNRHRFGAAMQLEVEVGAAGPDLRILPLLLLSLTENIFKHGDLTDAKEPGTLQIRTDGTQLIYYNRNLKKDRSGLDAGTHLGIDQARIRLAFYHPGRHKLTITDEGAIFTLKLTIDL